MNQSTVVKCGISHVRMLCTEFSVLLMSAAVKAFHIRFDEIKLDTNIQKWDVEILTVLHSCTYTTIAVTGMRIWSYSCSSLPPHQISKGRRHLDKASMMRFWDIMDRCVVPVITG